MRLAAPTVHRLTNSIPVIGTAHPNHGEMRHSGGPEDTCARGTVRCVFDPRRPLGIIFTGGGLVVRAYQDGDDRTLITLSNEVSAGAVARDLDNGKWRFDVKLRVMLSIDEDPVFDTDQDAVNHLVAGLQSGDRLQHVRQRLNRELLGLDDEYRGPRN